MPLGRLTQRHQMAVMESAAAEQSLKDSAAALQEEAVTLAVQIQVCAQSHMLVTKTVCSISLLACRCCMWSLAGSVRHC